MAEINLNNINKFYSKNHVVKDVSLNIKSKSFTVIVGPSGCGKSTILRMIAGLEDIDNGSISIDNKVVNELDPKDRNIAMVFQSYALYPHMNVYDNMAFGLKIEKRPKEEINERVINAAKILKIENLLERKPKQLSGGQRQRVAIGRAITRNPKVFLFDEPLSNLDAALRVEMRVELAKIHNKLNATMIYVTHDQTEAMTLADNIIVLDEGIISQSGTPLELYNKPRNLFVAGFIGSPKMNFLNGEVVSCENGQVLCKFLDNKKIIFDRKNNFKPGQKIVLGFRPEDLIANKTEEPEKYSRKAFWNGEVMVVEKLGSGSYLYINNKDENPLIVAVKSESKISQGDLINIGFDSEKGYLFDEKGQTIY